MLIWWNDPLEVLILTLAGRIFELVSGNLEEVNEYL